MSLRAVSGEDLVALVQFKTADRRTGKRVCALSIPLVAVVSSDAGETVPLFTCFTEEKKQIWYVHVRETPYALLSFYWNFSCFVFEIVSKLV